MRETVGGIDDRRARYARGGLLVRVASGTHSHQEPRCLKLWGLASGEFMLRLFTTTVVKENSMGSSILLINKEVVICILHKWSF